MSPLLGKSSRLACAAAFAVLLSHGTAHAWRAAYDVYELGADQPKGMDVVVTAVSSAALALGYLMAPGPSTTPPAIFSQDGLTTLIAPPNPLFSAYPVSINAAGAATYMYAEECYVWRNGASTIVPRAPEGIGFQCRVTDTDDIYGSSTVWATPVSYRNYRYSGGAFVDLGTWGAPIAKLTHANGNGDILAYRYDDSSTSLDTVRVRAGGPVEVLNGLLGATTSVAVAAMNERADVVGWLVLSTTQTRGFVVLGRTPQTFGLPGETTSRVIGINNRRVAVGYSEGTAAAGAVVWKRGVTTSIGRLPEALAAGWQRLDRATAINDNGVIVGVGTRNSGETRGFMLVPRR